MENLLKIDRSNCGRYPNALHAQFHNRMHALIAGEELATLHLSDALLKEWREYIDTEVSINREAEASILSKRMLEKDGERDKLLSYLFNTVSNERLNSVDNEAREAAERIGYAVDPYKGLQSEARDAETLHVIGLLEDLDKTEAKPDVQLLGLAPTVARLKTVNKEYQDLQTERMTLRVESKLPSAREIRPRTDAAYYLVCRYIDGSYVLGTPEVRTAIESLILRMNQLIGEAKTAYNLSMGQKKRGSGETPQPPLADEL
ncbi:DUF6261 family protein [Phocaeicola abscessus]